MPKIVNAWNEWDPLKRLILGRPEGTQVAGFLLGTWGMYPQEMVDEANEQMDHFCRILTERGIAIDRVEVHPVYREVRGYGTRLAACGWKRTSCGTTPARLP